jgi:hypothetical protein
MRTLAIVALCAAVAGCTPTPTDPASTALALDGTVELAVGSEVLVPGTDVKIRLREVAEDSRCPVDLACIWEGNARVIIVTVIDGIEQAHALNSSSAEWLEGSTRVEAGSHTITFESLLPEPRDGVAIPQKEYRLTILLSTADDRG